MEFIPLEKYSKKKGKQKETVKKQSIEQKKTVKKNEAVKEEVVKKSKAKPRTKVFEKKKVKNKYKETLELKQKKRIPKTKNKNLKEEEVEDDDEVVKEEEKEIGNKEIDDEGVETEEKDKETQEDEEGATEEEDKEDDNDEEAFKRKCQKLDERNKNRLFVRLKKKILNEAQIKEIHPDIKSVVFPRKKNTRWCWAVFASEERAHQAFLKLAKNKEVFVTKPISHERNSQRQKEKMKTILRKKEARKKLQKMWT